MSPAAAAPRPLRPVLDVSELPTTVFGHRGSIWWGTIGFMIVEGVTMIACVAAYFFVRRHFTAWPPLGTPMPGLLVPSLTLAVLLGAIPVYLALARAAKRLDAVAVRRWCWIGVALGVVAVVLRALEFEAVQVRWNANAYGTTVWAILVAHGTLLLVDVLETGTLAMIFALHRQEPKHFVDATDNSFYTYFMILAWVPQYVMLYLFPRWG